MKPTNDISRKSNLKNCNRGPTTPTALQYYYINMNCWGGGSFKVKAQSDKSAHIIFYFPIATTNESIDKEKATRVGVSQLKQKLD